MQLTGNQIAERSIISNYIPEGIQQQGIDCRLKTIKKFNGVEEGKISVHGHTTIPENHEIMKPIDGWYLLFPGYYEVEFHEGCNIPSNCAMYFKTRSSLVRCGSIIESGQFDAGFKTENMGAFLVVHQTINIEQDARIAQTIINETAEVDNLYDGQFQNDKQRS